MIRFQVVLSLIAVGISFAVEANAINLSSYKTMPVASVPCGVAVGDVTGDGRNDLVAITCTKSGVPDAVNDFNVRIYEQTVRGGFRVPVVMAYASNLRAYSASYLKLHDMNRDGIKDILIGHESGLTYIKGSSAGLFLPTRVSTGSNYGVTGLAVTDANLDGNLDVVVTRYLDTVSLVPARAAYGDGNGAFPIVKDLPADTISGPDVVRTGYNRYLTTAKMNADSFEDLISVGGGATIMRQNGVGAYRVTSFSGDSFYNLYADFTGDDFTDLAYWRRNGVQPDYLILNVQSVSGPFSYSGINVPVSEVPAAAVASDIDKDGDNDIVFVVANSPRLNIFERTEAGFVESGVFPLPGGSPRGGQQAIAVDDINSDGCNDVIVSDDEQGIVVLYGRMSPACVGYLPPRPDERGFRGQPATPQIKPTQRFQPNGSRLLEGVRRGAGHRK